MMAISFLNHFETCRNILEKFLKMHRGQVDVSKINKLKLMQIASNQIVKKQEKER